MLQRGLTAISVITLMVMTSSVLAQQFGGLLFPDVVPTDYFYDGVERFARKGIIKGYPIGRFGPHDYVTRGQATVIVDRYDQIVIRRLREQVDAMRQELGLGRCGDDTVQVGEECDDGNTLGGDGCSAECLAEIHCAGGYKVGDRYSAPDGCNVCTCTEAGIACTERACTQKKCFSSAECAQGDVCTAEQGDCRYPCPAGAVCIQACAGVCVPSSTSAVCGNGICDSGESAFPTRSGDELYCPQDCTASGPVCGNGLCDAGEVDEYKLGEDGPELLRRGTCPKDCSGGLTACQEQKKSIDVMFTKNLTCETDGDCSVFVRGCNPYLTCGKAVSKDALLQVTESVLRYAEDCASEEPTLCAGCLPKTARCVSGTCLLNE